MINKRFRIDQNIDWIEILPSIKRVKSYNYKYTFFVVAWLIWAIEYRIENDIQKKS